MGVGMVNITISGHPGSGTSTLVGQLEQHFSWSSLNGGQIFREQAKAHGMSLEEFGQLCTSNLEVDRELDEILKERMLSETSEIIESRLAGWWAYQLNIDCVRVWLSVSPEERARRVTQREGISIEVAHKANELRRSVDLSRFQELYGLNPEDTTPYTHIIEASSKTIGDLAFEVISILEAKQ